MRELIGRFKRWLARPLGYPERCHICGNLVLREKDRHPDMIDRHLPIKCQPVDWIELRKLGTHG